MVVLLPEDIDAYSAGTGRFGDESKVSMENWREKRERQVYAYEQTITSGVAKEGTGETKLF